MINLLPQKAKVELQFEKNKKLVIVLGNVALTITICLILILISIKFYILAVVTAQQNTFFNTEKSYQNPEDMALKEDIQTYNANLVKVNNFYKNELYFSDTVKTILHIQRPQGVYFTGMNLDSDKTQNKVKVSIAGISDTRDNLLTFKDNLEKSDTLHDIYFPADSWVKQKDVTFNVTFEVN